MEITWFKIFSIFSIFPLFSCFLSVSSHNKTPSFSLFPTSLGHWPLSQNSISKTAKNNKTQLIHHFFRHLKRVLAKFLCQNRGFLPLVREPSSNYWFTWKVVLQSKYFSKVRILETGKGIRDSISLIKELLKRICCHITRHKTPQKPEFAQNFGLHRRFCWFREYKTREYRDHPQEGWFERNLWVFCSQFEYFKSA